MLTLEHNSNIRWIGKTWNTCNIGLYIGGANMVTIHQSANPKMEKTPKLGIMLAKREYEIEKSGFKA